MLKSLRSTLIVLLDKFIKTAYFLKPEAYRSNENISSFTIKYLKSPHENEGSSFSLIRSL